MTVSSGIYADIPGAPAEGDLYIPTDATTLFCGIGGGAWNAWGPIYPLTQPPSAGWSWVNQGGATVDSTNGGILLDHDGSGGAGVNLRVRVRSIVPSVTITTMSLGHTDFVAGTPGWGVCFRDSGAGKLLIWQHVWASVVNVVRYSSPTAVATVMMAENSPRYTTQIALFVRMVDDGSDLFFYTSRDGQEWILQYTEAVGAYLTPDEAGFFVNPINYGVCNRLMSWKEA